VFEILLEKEKGWGTALDPSGWGRRVFEGGFLAQVCEKPYLTVYHIVIFGLIVPAILFSEFLIVRSLPISHAVATAAQVALTRGWIIEIGNVRLIPMLFLGAVWFSVLAVEDGLWFIMNWYYPGSARDLFSGKVWWHTRWLSFGEFEIPRFYVSANLLAASLLLASICLSR